ncbi:hypothetical protein EXN22_13920 [Pseudomonas tructae]|uniref:Uncharacterized protein n=1 Tax=Pseudomonas tructae TaxID=2518644 RepID=A0A411MIY2_9PSED|nr:hypothetical protein [Pseudomonas tructae]QBF26740.1 hypothetical protein EXN22_13920 [Pseudomonas tructae]
MLKPIKLVPHPPFNPIHDGLYSADELLSGFTPDNPLSVIDTADYLSYLYFQQNGRTTITDPFAGMMQALHDASIVQGMNKFLHDHLEKGRRPVAIMGGHRENRGSDTYRAVAKIAQMLSECGFLVASGGGPGCMEAAHLGSLFAGQGEKALTDSINRLEKEAPSLPKNMGSVLTQDKNTRTWFINEEYAEELAVWMMPAWRIAQERKAQLKPENQSLAVPTWHYGHEPLTPLATHIAKYFLNSIREDVLLALASSGIIYSEGRAGTLQEVFQDASQIYYRQEGEPVTSMVFFDSAFWTEPEQPDKKVHLPVCDLLFQLFVGGGKMTKEDFARYIRKTDTPEEAVKIITDNAPPVERVISNLVGIGMTDVDVAQVKSALAKFQSLLPE